MQEPALIRSLERQVRALKEQVSRLEESNRHKNKLLLLAGMKPEDLTLQEKEYYRQRGVRLR